MQELHSPMWKLGSRKLSKKGKSALEVWFPNEHILYALLGRKRGTESENHLVEPIPRSLLNQSNQPNQRTVAKETKTI